MHALKNTLFISILFALFPAYGQVKNEPVIIAGTVMTEKNEPVYNAHVYVVDGEEEALTNNKGEFSIRSWQKAPLKLTIEKPGSYQRISIVISDPLRKQVIRLKK